MSYFSLLPTELFSIVLDYINEYKDFDKFIDYIKFYTDIKIEWDSPSFSGIFKKDINSRETYCNYKFKNCIYVIRYNKKVFKYEQSYSIIKSEYSYSDIKSISINGWSTSIISKDNSMWQLYYDEDNKFVCFERIIEIPNEMIIPVNKLIRGRFYFDSKGNVYQLLLLMNPGKYSFIPIKSKLFISNLYNGPDYTVYVTPNNQVYVDYCRNVNFGRKQNQSIGLFRIREFNNCMIKSPKQLKMGGKIQNIFPLYQCFVVIYEDDSFYVCGNWNVRDWVYKCVESFLDTVSHKYITDIMCDTEYNKLVIQYVNDCGVASYVCKYSGGETRFGIFQYKYFIYSDYLGYLKDKELHLYCNSQKEQIIYDVEKIEIGYNVLLYFKYE